MASGANITTTIEIDDHGATDRLAAFPHAQAQAISRALNRTIDWCRTRTLQAITGNLAIKKSDLDGRHRFGGVTTTRATPEKQTSNMNITGKRIPLFRFGGKPTQPPTPRGISYRLDAGGGRERITENAFVARFKSGHTGFFRRVNSNGQLRHTSGPRMGKKIRTNELAELRGPSIPHVAENRPEFKKLLAVDAGERLQMQMEREENFILTGTSKGAA